MSSVNGVTLSQFDPGTQRTECAVPEASLWQIEARHSCFELCRCLSSWPRICTAQSSRGDFRNLVLSLRAEVSPFLATMSHRLIYADKTLMVDLHGPHAP